MLIWKVIAASPGITRAQIWERVEYDIPVGYAMRRYPASRKAGKNAFIPASTARSYVLSDVLQEMRKRRTITREGAGHDSRYTAVRQPLYRRDPDKIDETGTKAAEHMALAEALRTVEKMLPRRLDRTQRKTGPAVSLSDRECDAVALIARALRAKS